MDRIPVLWLCGPPGVGKSTVGWRLFERLSDAGVATAYVDIDQLGMCYAPPTAGEYAPDPSRSDPGRYRMKSDNLAEVLATFQSAGARCAVVSGVTDPEHGVAVDRYPHATLTLCRLRGSHDELRHRLAGRGRPGDDVDGTLSYADVLDRAGHGDLTIDTTGLSVDEVIDLVRERAGGWPVLPDGEPEAAPRPDPTPVPAEILWVCGPTAVGKSTAGYQAWDIMRRDGVAAFVDLDQIGFLRPAPAGDPRNHDVKARNLAALWQTYHAIGAQRLVVVVGPLDADADVHAYTAAMPAATITICRLHADPEQLTERVMLRGQGGGPPIAGDALNGQPTPVLKRAAREATAHAEAIDRANVGDLRIDTNGQTPEQTAREILSLSPSKR
ncbi:AAA family ATPase [Phytohabitans aurantiacus]|uniref:AAA family ATPase n=1 Tax=Phytohabitans aurantiacus TaxID=3016789 RepID=UPI00248FE6D8|nr:AAA family ATPase [Phytohabitans aurantiacus]